MNGASKILTVSYGTFSCTLEGFDDPFNTMKAIAEYFRDLAAGDRYFGAEPPVPDAAMLHRIAEREIHRRVEAKIQDNGVILRAGDADEAPSLPAEVIAPAVVAADDSITESVAARLQRIRAKHSANLGADVTALAPVVVEAPAAPSEDIYIEDEHAEDVADLSPAPGAAEPQIDIPDQIEDILDEAENDRAMIDLSDQFANLDQSEGLATETADHADDDAILASLQSDLPEDVAAPVVDAGEPVDLPEDFAPEDIADDMAFDGMFDDEETAAAPQEDFAADLDDEDADDDMDGLLARLSEEPAQIVETVQSDAPAETPVALDEDALLANLIEEPDQQQPAPRARARVIRIRRADPPEPVAEAIAAEPTITDSALSDEAEAALQAELAALEAEINGVVEPAPAKAPEVQRPAPTEDDAVNRLMAQANSEMSGEETRRRQSAIAHLKAAVAATEADRMAGVSDAGKPEERLEAYREDLDRVVRPRRPVSAARQTDVVDQAPAEPTRPTPLVLVSAQRIDRTPAPADANAPRVVMPVRPRRISGSAAAMPAAMAEESLAAAEDRSVAQVMQEPDQVELDEDDILAPDETDNVFAEATSFEDFADQLGATQLSDLLEAAAVYCAEVLQRPEFSRPLVMRQVASIPGQTEISREDYLRGFGTLLRQGRISKVKRGMFAVTDRSPYLAEARKIAG